MVGEHIVWVQVDWQIREESDPARELTILMSTAIEREITVTKIAENEDARTAKTKIRQTPGSLVTPMPRIA